MTTPESTRIDVRKMIETFDECERQIYNTLSKFNQKIANASESSNFLKRYLSVSDRSCYSKDVLELLNNFMLEIETALSFTLEKIEDVAVSRARLADRFAVLWQIRVLLNDATVGKRIQEQLTKHFGDEHTWKREISTEFLRVLSSYDEEPSEDKKNNLIHRIAMLTNNTLNKNSLEDSEAQTCENLRKTRERLHKDIYQLMNLNARAERLKHILLRCEADI